MRYAIVYKTDKDLLPVVNYVAVFPDDTSDYEISETLNDYWWEAIKGRVYEPILSRRVYKLKEDEK